MKKMILTAIAISAILVGGCGEEKTPPVQQTQRSDIDLSSAKDGVYTVDSSRDDKLGYSTLTLSIENHKITAVDFKGVDLFGNVKDEEYGSLTGKDSADYKKAQTAVKAIGEYARQLQETQSLKKVDAISGATISYKQFVETVEKAVDAANR